GSEAVETTLMNSMNSSRLRPRSAASGAGPARRRAARPAGRRLGLNVACSLDATYLYDGQGERVAQQVNRHSNGTIHTSFGCAGQRNDSVSGLIYSHARWMDPFWAISPACSRSRCQVVSTSWVCRATPMWSATRSPKTDPTGTLRGCRPLVFLTSTLVSMPDRAALIRPLAAAPAS